MLLLGRELRAACASTQGQAGAGQSLSQVSSTTLEYQCTLQGIHRKAAHIPMDCNRGPAPTLHLLRQARRQHGPGCLRWRPQLRHHRRNLLIASCVLRPWLLHVLMLHESLQAWLLLLLHLLLLLLLLACAGQERCQ
jgi:hypothetical protein